MTLPTVVTPTPWDALKNFTDARLALGRAGVSMPSAAHLAFQLAHAQARDAVHLPLDSTGLSRSLQDIGLTPLLLHSQATDRATYLQRPDWGRRLDDRSRQTLLALRDEWQRIQPPRDNAPRIDSGALFDLAWVVADGLSARAIHQNAMPLLTCLLQRLQAQESQAWSMAPVCVVEQGRVAIGDDIGTLLGARMVVVLIGERPGLSSPDSLGIYMTWAPQPGTKDAARNCISNVRPAGMSVEQAAHKLHHLMTLARRMQLTGIGLKDEVDSGVAHHRYTASARLPAQSG